MLPERRGHQHLTRHRTRVDARRGEPFQLDVTVDRLRLDRTGHAQQADEVVDRAGRDIAIDIGDVHFTLDRVDLQRALARAHHDVAAHGLRAHGRTQAGHIDVALDARELHRQPHGNGERPLDLQRLFQSVLDTQLEPTIHEFGDDAVGAIVLGDHAHFIARPRGHPDVAGEVDERQCRPGADPHDGVGGHRAACAARCGSIDPLDPLHGDLGTVQEHHAVARDHDALVARALKPRGLGEPGAHELACEHDGVTARLGLTRTRRACTGNDECE